LSHKNCYFGGVFQISVFNGCDGPIKMTHCPPKKKERKKEEKTIKQTWEAAHLMKRSEVNSKQQMNLA